MATAKKSAAKTDQPDDEGWADPTQDAFDREAKAADEAPAAEAPASDS